MKLKIIIATTCIFQVSCAISQKHCNCEAIFNAKNHNYVVYSKNSSTSKILYILGNDSIKENYFTVELHNSKKGWGLITAYSPSIRYNKKGWVNMDEMIISPSDFSEPLYLYEEPDYSADKKEVINYNFYPLNILDCKSGWLQVRYTDSEKTIIGWLPKENQCANPYTTCN